MTKAVSKEAREAAEAAYLECYADTPNDLWLAALIAGKHDDDPQVKVMQSLINSTLDRAAAVAHAGTLEGGFKPEGYVYACEVLEAAILALKETDHE